RRLPPLPPPHGAGAGGAGARPESRGSGDPRREPPAGVPRHLPRRHRGDRLRRRAPRPRHPARAVLGAPPHPGRHHHRRHRRRGQPARRAAGRRAPRHRRGGHRVRPGLGVGAGGLAPGVLRGAGGAAGGAVGSPRLTALLGAAALAAALLVPALGSRDLGTATLFTVPHVTLALNYDILGGFLGYMSLGQGAFFGLAAYATVLALNSGCLDPLGPADMPVAVLLATAVTAVVALGFAYPLFRLSGAYFAMATFAMVLLIRQFILNLPELTGGSYGVYVNPRHYLALPVADGLALGLLLAAVALNRAIARSRTGLAVTAVRDSELAASTIGLDVFRVKRRVLVVSAVPSALAGGIFGLQAGYIDVDAALGVDKTLLPVIMA